MRYDDDGDSSALLVGPNSLNQDLLHVVFRVNKGNRTKASTLSTIACGVHFAIKRTYLSCTISTVWLQRLRCCSILSSRTNLVSGLTRTTTLSARHLVAEL
ncbi:hypothetical protein PsorP6_013979 [Peronosclerospora sorghi]|uniref:Uncharacterized protein n=1 Tax=Peronosclerospora sorghi TaxID=230839 RepID=A0ACC0VHH1_9STRA|nr:hypothetical protein PsorP6_013979 [Peronosclerospora sorghi]